MDYTQYCPSQNDITRMLQDAVEHTIVTVCGEDAAMGKAAGAQGELFVCLKNCSPSEYARIREQADKWAIREKRMEWYDYDFYANLGGEFTFEREIRIDSKRILSKNGAFWGVVVPSSAQEADLRYICTEDYQDKPLFLYGYEEPRDWNDLSSPLISFGYYLVKCGPEQMRDDG